MRSYPPSCDLSRAEPETKTFNCGLVHEGTHYPKNTRLPQTLRSLQPSQPRWRSAWLRKQSRSNITRGKPSPVDPFPAKELRSQSDLPSSPSSHSHSCHSPSRPGASSQEEGENKIFGSPIATNPTTRVDYRPTTNHQPSNPSLKSCRRGASRKKAHD